MDIEKICKDNLGKIVDYKGFKAKVIGYNIAINYLIVSLSPVTNYELIGNDSNIIILNENGNFSYAYIHLNAYKEELKIT